MAKVEKKSTKKKVRASFFTKLLLLALLVALGLQLYHLRGQVQDAEAQKAQLTEQVQQKQEENDRLQESIQNGGSQEEMEKIARDELGLIYPDERVFNDISN